MATLLSIRLGKLERAASLNRLVRYDVSNSPAGTAGSDREMSEGEWISAFKPADA
ncbi:hypothetical protein ACLNGM_20280 [Aureimonas phyllosphaerae]|uniref:hypothetical protein n=1 Tax=Aureimonas phyllosphaerae TaxID=1166078 RepID=UPI003A5BF6D9